eukprot:g936.t1
MSETKTEQIKATKSSDQEGDQEKFLSSSGPIVKTKESKRIVSESKKEIVKRQKKQTVGVKTPDGSGSLSSSNTPDPADIDTDEEEEKDESSPFVTSGKGSIVERSKRKGSRWPFQRSRADKKKAAPSSKKREKEDDNEMNEEEKSEEKERKKKKVGGSKNKSGFKKDVSEDVVLHQTKSGSNLLSCDEPTGFFNSYDHTINALMVDEDDISDFESDFEMSELLVKEVKENDEEKIKDNDEKETTGQGFEVAMALYETTEIESLLDHANSGAFDRHRAETYKRGIDAGLSLPLLPFQNALFFEDARSGRFSGPRIIQVASSLSSKKKKDLKKLHDKKAESKDRFECSIPLKFVGEIFYETCLLLVTAISVCYGYYVQKTKYRTDAALIVSMNYFFFFFHTIQFILSTLVLMYLFGKVLHEPEEGFTDSYKVLVQKRKQREKLRENVGKKDVSKPALLVSKINYNGPKPSKSEKGMLRLSSLCYLVGFILIHSVTPFDQIMEADWDQAKWPQGETYLENGHWREVHTDNPVDFYYLCPKYVDSYKVNGSQYTSEYRMNIFGCYEEYLGSSLYEEGAYSRREYLHQNFLVS